MFKKGYETDLPEGRIIRQERGAFKHRDIAGGIEWVAVYAGADRGERDRSRPVFECHPERIAVTGSEQPGFVLISTTPDGSDGEGSTPSTALWDRAVSSLWGIRAHLGMAGRLRRLTNPGSSRRDPLRRPMGYGWRTSGVARSPHRS